MERECCTKVKSCQYCTDTNKANELLSKAKLKPRTVMITDPIEKIVADALDAINVKYTHEMERVKKESILDFYLPEHDIYIECKHSYTPRSDKQLQDNTNVILIQGRKAAEAFAKLVTIKEPA